MQVRKISAESGIERLRQVRQYENDKYIARLGLVLELADGEDVDQALAWASNFLLSQLERLIPITATEAGLVTQQQPVVTVTTPTSDDPDWDVLPSASESIRAGQPQQQPVTAPAQAGQGRPDALTDKQLKAIYAIARAVRKFGEDQTDARCREMFNCRPEDLSKAEASQFIDALKLEQGT